MNRPLTTLRWQHVERVKNSCEGHNFQTDYYVGLLNALISSWQMLGLGNQASPFGQFKTLPFAIGNQETYPGGADHQPRYWKV